MEANRVRGVAREDFRSHSSIFHHTASRCAHALGFLFASTLCSKARSADCPPAPPALNVPGQAYAVLVGGSRQTETVHSGG